MVKYKGNSSLDDGRRGRALERTVTGDEEFKVVVALRVRATKLWLEGGEGSRQTGTRKLESPGKLGQVRRWTIRRNKLVG